MIVPGSDHRALPHRAALQLAFMANQAYEMLHAIGITLFRLGITEGRLLEWETAAASAVRSGRSSARAIGPAQKGSRLPHNPSGPRRHV
jgi:hypothetical protein